MKEIPLTQGKVALEEEAVEAYQKTASKNFGEFARFE